MRPLFVSYFAAKADGTQTRGWLVLDAVGPLVDAAAVMALHRQIEEQLGHEPGMLSVVGFQRLEAHVSEVAPKKLSRQEAHDLGQIIKERVKVLEAHADEQAAKCMADFEKKVSAIYSYDQDEVWKEATERALEEIKRCQEKIDARCHKLGIPKDLSPRLVLSWEGRGQMKTASRREELRRVAKREVEAMKAAALTKIRRQSLDLRTQVVSMSLVTAEAAMFLDSFAPVEEAMHSIDFSAIETKMLEQQATTKRLGHGGLYELKNPSLQVTGHLATGKLLGHALALIAQIGRRDAPMKIQECCLTYRKLLDRLKKAVGPDRVLDRDIARLATENPTGWRHPCMSAWGKGVPHYTKSFEAALTLLPPVVYVEVSGSTDTFQPGVWPAVSLRWLPPGQDNPKKWNGTVHGAPSFALAMCLAAVDVRARMAEG